MEFGFYGQFFNEKNLRNVWTMDHGTVDQILDAVVQG